MFRRLWRWINYHFHGEPYWVCGCCWKRRKLDGSCPSGCFVDGDKCGVHHG